MSHIDEQLLKEEVDFGESDLIQTSNTTEYERIQKIKYDLLRDKVSQKLILAIESIESLTG